VYRGRGRDADLAVLVDKSIAARWWRNERESIRVRWPDAFYSLRWLIKAFAPFLYEATIRERKHARLTVAARILEINIDSLMDAGGHFDVELFLMPIDWRIEKTLNTSAIEEITDLLNDANTRGFLHRIANDALRIA